MRVPFKRTVAAVTILAFILLTVGCTTCRYVPIKTAEDVSHISFEPTKTYKVEFTTGQKYNLKGENLSRQNNLIGVRFEERESFHYYQREQINSICAEEKSKGKTTAAIVGGVLGGLALIAGLVIGISLASWKEKNE
jgi:hypothetical protein